MRRLFRSLPTLVLLCVVSTPALSVNTSVLYDKPEIAVIPLLYNGEVLFQDYVQGSYRLYVLPIDGGNKSEIRNNGSKYLYPLDFGGSHAAWISYVASGTSGGGLFKSTSPVDPVDPGTPPADAAYYVKGLSMDTQSESDLASDTAYKEFVAVDGKKAVWTDYRHFSTADTTIDVYLYDHGTNKETRLTDNRSYKSHPDIQGNHVVWSDFRNTSSDKYNADIFLYDLSKNEETPICTEPGYQAQACVYGDRIVWQDYRNADSDSKNADIYLYDLSKNEEKPICTAEGYQCYPKIYGDIVVWHDYRNTDSDSKNADIYFYDLSTGEESEVTLKSGYQGPPYLYGDYIVWQDYTDNKLYVGHLGEATVVRPAARSADVIGRHRNNATAVKYFDIRGRHVSSRAREASGPGAMARWADGTAKMFLRSARSR